MLILGISAYFHDASASLIQDGQLIAAAEEERFSRIKHDFAFPYNAIRFCLDYAGVEGRDVDYVVFFEKPFLKFERLMKTAISGFPRTYPMFVQSMRTWLFDKLWVKNTIQQAVGIDKSRILFSEHHISHAASAFFCSPFEKSSILTFDGVGEWATTTMGIGDGSSLKLTHELRFPHSIGLLYSAFTAFLGFEVNEGEYKVMGMAAYGTPRYVDKIWQIVHRNGDGSLWMDSKYFSFHYSTNRSYTYRFKKLFGKPRDPTVPFFTDATGYPDYYGRKPRNYVELVKYNQHYADIAASIQLVTEEIIIDLVKELHRQNSITDLCMAGGVALNSVANGRILRETPIERLYIQPSAGDGGASLGAALYAWHCELGNSDRFVMDHAYWGQEYDADAIMAALAESGLASKLVDDDSKLIELTIDRLTSGKVVGWFQGRFEWGPRALGNRSIIADPRRGDMKDIVNNKIKFREPFRPFAPSVLAEELPKYFDVPDAGFDMPNRFMLLVVPVKAEHAGTIPAVNHMGTARPQAVHKETNSLYYNLIERFRVASGVPLILNTSFNVRGEPIVNSPENAINTFLNSGIDTLVMGNYLVDKP